MPVSSWSTSAASNTTVGGVDIAENCARAGMNNAMRAIMAEAKAGFLEGISVKTHGAVGDGVTDDTTACNNAHRAAEAAGTSVIYPPGTYLVTAINIRNGARAVIGMGGTIKASDASGVFVLQGKHVGMAANVTACRFVGLNIDLNNTAAFAFNCQNPVACQFIGNRVINAGSSSGAILIKSWDAGLEAARDNLVQANILDGTGNTTASGVSLQSEGSYTVDDTEIAFNRCYGWQYAVGASAAPRTKIVGGTYTGASRCISIQDGCHDSQVVGGQMRLFTGVAVHVVASNRVAVTGAKAYTDSTVYTSGEGVFQAMKGSEECTFTSCETNVPSTGTTAPEFHFYAGASVSRTKFVNCRAKGIVSRSYFCLESAYKNGGSAYGRSKSGVVEADATGDTADAGFEGCEVNGTSALPAFAFIQTTSTGPTVRALTRPIFTDCRTFGDSYNYHVYLAEETASNLSAMVLVGFNCQSGVSSAKFNLPRASAHCAQIEGNSHTTLGGAWTAFTPIVAAGAGAFTTVAAEGRYRQEGKNVHVTIKVTITTNGTANTYFTVTGPVAAYNAGAANYVPLSCVETSAFSGVTGQAVITPGNTPIFVKKYDGTYLGGDGYVINIAGTYEAA